MTGTGVDGIGDRSENGYMDICKVTHTARVWINRVKGCQSCSWSAEQGSIIFPCPRSRLRIWSRETGSAVPSRISLLISMLGLNVVLTYGMPPELDRSGDGNDNWKGERERLELGKSDTS